MKCWSNALPDICSGSLKNLGDIVDTLEEYLDSTKANTKGKKNLRFLWEIYLIRFSAFSFTESEATNSSHIANVLFVVSSRVSYPTHNTLYSAHNLVVPLDLVVVIPVERKEAFCC